MSQLEYKTRQSEAVGIFRVTKITGVLTPSEDWIDSLVEAEVVEVLKGSRLDLVEGQMTLTFRAPGGKAIVGNTMVSAESPAFDQLQLGQTYLLFFFYGVDGVLQTSSYGMFEVTPTRLRGLDHQESLVDFEGQPDARIGQIRTFGRLAPVYPKGGVR